ncbi:MAG: sugar ABC transporter substrate-binding protein [Opitutae bacterium]|nr:sugar ABC transporter substrate-binding protein [Opitutae bacterium]
MPAFAAPFKVGVLVKDRTPYWHGFEASACEAATALNVEAVAKTPAMLSAPLQLKYLEQIAQAGVQAIVISPVGDELVAPLSALKKKGVHIVTLNTELTAAAADAFVGTDFSKMTDLGAKTFAERVSDGEEAAVFRIADINMTGFSDREQAALKIMKQDRPKTALRTDVFFPGAGPQGLAQAKRLLEKYPACKAVFAGGYEATVAMVRAIKETGRTGKTSVVGFGTTGAITQEVAEAIESGVLAALVCVDSAAIGRKGMETAVALLEKKPVLPAIMVDNVVVTRANLKNYKVVSSAPVPAT